MWTHVKRTEREKESDVYHPLKKGSDKVLINF